MNFNLERLAARFNGNVLSIFPQWYGRPLHLTLFVTDRCNSRCITCSYWRHKGGSDLPSEYMLKFVHETLDWLGPRHFILTGGEPLLHEDIFEVVRVIHRKGGDARILTNGLLLDDRMIDRLVGSRISKISISVNALDPEIHDFSRGVPGNQEKIFRAVDYLRDKYPHVVLEFAMLIYEQTLDQIVPMIEYTHRKGIYLNLQPLQPVFTKYPSAVGSQGDVLERLWPKNHKKVSDVFKKIQRYRAKGYPLLLFNSYLRQYLRYFRHPESNRVKRCALGFCNLILESNGDIKLCYKYPAIGNIGDHTPEQSWNGTVAQHQRKQMSHCMTYCPVSLCTLRPSFRDLLETVIYKGKTHAVLALDRECGKCGIFLKTNFPKLYERLKKTKA